MHYEANNYYNKMHKFRNKIQTSGKVEIEN